MPAPSTLDEVRALYDFTGRTAVITGGTGVLGREMARALAVCNANVALLARNVARAEETLAAFPETAGQLLAIKADVLDRPALEEAVRVVQRERGPVDMLVNGAGGNDPKATTNPDQRFFDLPLEALQTVTNLNLLGTMLPTQVFARSMAERRQ